MSEIGSRYRAILQELPRDVTLIAVTKGRTAQECQELYTAGCRDFGESRALEFLEKRSLLPGDIRWHFIGRLQKNKVGKVIGRCSLIHSVDSVELAQAISSRATAMGVRADLLLQVNTSGESSKQGFTPEALEGALPRVEEMAALCVQGLMAMAPLVDDESAIAKCFGDLYALRDRLRRIRAEAALLPHLSMGMSRDYRIAVASGATMVRIGSALFL